MSRQADVPEPPPRKLFGTDGIRGVANVEPMTAETVTRLGRAIAHVVGGVPGHRSRILIGKDTRLSGYLLEEALACGIVSMGVEAQFVGPLPTPGIAFLIQDMRADAGAVISASHNPYQDNGIKLFGGDGFKLPDELEARIETLIETDELDGIRPTADQIGKSYRISDARGRYVVYLKSTFPKGRTLEGLKIALDCANGAAYRVAPLVFEELGAEVVAVGVEPDGKNINAGVGSMHPESVAQAVRRSGADLGISLDGDADRVVFVDHEGEVVDGDRILAVTALDMKRRSLLSHDTVVATVMSNLGLERTLGSAGIQLLRTPVGDRNVVAEMRRGGFNLGGEQSGHVIFLDHATTGDGILSALQLLAVIVESGRSLRDLGKVMVSVPQVMVNVRVRERRPLESVPAVVKRMRQVEAALGEQGRLLVRFSGTEPLARVMIEGENLDEIRGLADDVGETIRKAMG